MLCEKAFRYPNLFPDLNLSGRLIVVCIGDGWQGELVSHKKGALLQNGRGTYDILNFSMISSSRCPSLNRQNVCSKCNSCYHIENQEKVQEFSGSKSNPL